MDATTARSELLGRMPELHRMFRERTNAIDYDDDWVLEIDFLMIAIWMYGDRELVVDHLDAFTGKNVVIGEGDDDLLSADLSRAILATEKNIWLECVESLADHVPHLPDVDDLELLIRVPHTMELVNVVLDRLKAIRSLRVCVHAFNPTIAGTKKFILSLDRLGPLDYLFLEGITDRSVFWSKIVKYVFHKPPEKILALAGARDSRLVAPLTAIRSTAMLVPNVSLYDCIIDDELFSFLLTMPISALCFGESSRIRGDFLTVADALASNTALKLLIVECDEACSSFTEALSNGIANNAALEVLTNRCSAVQPFSAVCRGVGRNGSIRDAELLVSDPMDEACMYELAQCLSLQHLLLVVRGGPGIFSWSAMASFLRANPSLKVLQITELPETSDPEGFDPSDDDLRMIGQSLADNTSLEWISLPRHSKISTWQGHADFVVGLGCNTTLRFLTFAASPDRKSRPSRAVLEQVMERNYSLEDVTFNKGDSSPLVETICTLNAAGRKYMLADPTSRVKGVDVLSRVINHLDCLYFHLRENPNLCDLNERAHDMSPSPAKSTKRRRSSLYTAEQCVGMPCESRT